MSNAKTNRESSRTQKHSILLSNVTAIVFAPVSITSQTDDSDNENKALLRSSPTELLEAFKERNSSSMRTRLYESLEEIRVAGWIAPCTLLIKGPLEELEVIKEAWRRHFLRSPEGLLIRDIGSVASVEMEVIQQSPFLPLARALYEAIAAMNENGQPATQKSIVDFLFETYQYVHVPKLNVIHGCLGILIKENKIYHNSTGYFVSSAPSPALDKPEVSPRTDDNNMSPLAKESIRCGSCQVATKAEYTKENAPKQEQTVKVVNRSMDRAANVIENTAGEPGQDADKRVVEPLIRQSRRDISTGKTAEVDKKLGSSSDESNPKDAKKSSDFTEKEQKCTTKEKRKHRKDSNTSNSATRSDTSSSTSERAHKKNHTKHKQNQEGKKPKRNVFSQMSCLISKTVSTAVIFQEEANSAVPKEESTPFVDTQIKEDRVGVVSNDTPSVLDTWKSRTEDKEENKVQTPDADKDNELRDLRLSVSRTRSFVQASKKRQDHATRRISFTANTDRASARFEQPAEDLVRPDERRARANKAESASRNVSFRRSMPSLSRPSAFPVGIVRPLTNSHTTDNRAVSLSSSAKTESSRKSSASGSTPSSTPKMKEKAAGHARRSVPPKDSPKGLESHMPFRTMDNQIYRVEKPLKQLPCSNAKPKTSSSFKVRETVPAKTRHFGPSSHFMPAPHVQNKTAARRSTAPIQACEYQSYAGKHGESTQTPRTSAMCYDNCKVTEESDHYKCCFRERTCAELSATHGQMSDLLDSQDICLEAVSSSDCSDLYHLGAERYLDVKPVPPRQFVDGESRYDESLTFIGII